MSDPRPRAVRALDAAGIVAAAVLALAINLWSTRHFVRADWTADAAYTLSDGTRETLRVLPDGVTLVALLGRGDPLAEALRQLTPAYQAEAPSLAIRWVDPERDTAEFLALQEQHGLVAGRTDDGRVVADAVVLLTRGDATWFVTPEDLAGDEDDPALAWERALTRGLRELADGRRSRVCFSTGHGEALVDDHGPSGLWELGRSLTRENHDVGTVDPSAPGALEGCQVVVVAGPARRLEPAALGALAAYRRAGGALLLLLPPTLSAEGALGALPFGELLDAVGVTPSGRLVLEADPERTVPSVGPATFFADPVEHPITRGLFRGDDVELRVLVQEAQSLSLAERSGAAPLLRTTARARTIADLRRWDDAAAADAPAERTLAVAHEPADTADGGRLVVVGAVSLAHSRTLRAPGGLGARLWLESALAWLAARPPPVFAARARGASPSGGTLTDESLNEVARYVFLYLPGTAALLGWLLLRQRLRTRERARRREVSP